MDIIGIFGEKKAFESRIGLVEARMIRGKAVDKIVFSGELKSMKDCDVLIEALNQVKHCFLKNKTTAEWKQ